MVNDSVLPRIKFNKYQFRNILNLMSKNFFLIVYYTLDNLQIQVTSVDTDFQLTIFGIQKNRRELNVKQEN